MIGVCIVPINDLEQKDTTVSFVTMLDHINTYHIYVYKADSRSLALSVLFCLPLSFMMLYLY